MEQLSTSQRWATAALLALRTAATVYVAVELGRALIDNPLLAGAVFAIFCATIAGWVLRWTLLLLIPAEVPTPLAPEGYRVAMVTSFVPKAESFAMLENTLRGMVSADYAHDTWVLDEGNDPEVKRLCGRMGASHFSRRDRPEYLADNGQFQRATKHGNYNAWLAEVGFRRYDVLAALDPDQVPARNFLTATLGFFANPSIAYVQSPQTFYNIDRSWIAHGADEEARDFYWIAQRVYGRHGTPSVIGAHNLHRMAALESVGGLAPHVADDLLLTLRYQLAGLRGVYVPRLLAQGLAPVDWPTYMKQQRRWARSLFDVKFRFYPRLSGMRARARIVGALQGLTYLQDAVVALGVVFALAVALSAGVPSLLSRTIQPPAFLAALAVLAVTGLWPHRFHGGLPGHSGFYWRAALLRFAKWPYVLQGVWEALRAKSTGYDLTNKQSTTARRAFVMWPHLLIVACLLGAALIGDARNDDTVIRCLASGYVLVSVGLLLSGFLPTPPAFDEAPQKFTSVEPK